MRLAALNAREVRLLLRRDGTADAHLHELRIPTNGVERRPKLVRHGAEKIRLRGVRGLSLGPRGLRVGARDLCLRPRRTCRCVKARTLDCLRAAVGECLAKRDIIRRVLLGVGPAHEGDGAEQHVVRYHRHNQQRTRTQPP